MYFEVILGFGSNLGDRSNNLTKAISYCDFLKSPKISKFIENQALLPEGAPLSWDIPYLNCAISGKTKLNPEKIFIRIKKIEKLMGRDSLAPRWSPRVIDIDILFFDKLTIKTPELIIPHTEVFKRPFAINTAIECCPKITNYFMNG